MISGSQFPLFTLVKNTSLFVLIFIVACGSSSNNRENDSRAQIISPTDSSTTEKISPIVTGADNTDAYLKLLQNRRVGIVTNQTGILTNKVHVVDYLLANKIKVTKIFAPEHGFRGTADAGEHINDGKDSKTGLPIVSLYGNNKKPTSAQLTDIDLIVFDLQDVGARFYTYISSLHYIMEACAENNIPLIVLDRPNPNGGIVDGPILEKQHQSFIGMHPVPILHGMTIGEYAKMINGEKWLSNEVKCELTIIPCLNYKRSMSYTLPVPPSPNLPNAKAINLYASLCLFEGTNVSVGRGTNKQFQIYGSPFLPNLGYTFTPQPNFGAKDPLHKGKECFGEDLSAVANVDQLELKWLLKAYHETKDQSEFFIPFFTKLAGTTVLQHQIENGLPESKIRESWKAGLTLFKQRRQPYLIY